MENPLTVQPHHIKLLQRMNVRWGTIEFGAPEIDGKRPYGNSSVVQDIREITEMEGAKREWCVQVHREMEAVLQIFLEEAGDLSPGDEICYHDYKWQLVDDVEGE